MKENALPIIVAVISSNALFVFIQYLLERFDKKVGIQKKLATLEKDVLRTQLLLLILLKPGETQEILTIAEHYFGTLKGNWYMTSIFNKWLNEKNIAEPEWFNSRSQ